MPPSEKNQRTSHDANGPETAGVNPANRLGLSYHDVPPRRVDCRIVDIHTHVRPGKSTQCFFAAAAAYGISHVVTMTPRDEVDELQRRFGDRIEFIAVPNWRKMSSAESFRDEWLDDLEFFRNHGARRMKFWVAPPMRGHIGLVLQDDFFKPLIRRGLELEYDFMIHVADPSIWFAPGGRYADATQFGTKHEQYSQLEYLLEAVAPRNVIAAHMGGNIEEPAFLDNLLERYPNLYLDTSATKWIVREVSRQPDPVRDFMIRNQTRILFGSDLVVADNYDFIHYASRYWAHQALWESDYRGESPIADPDADDPPQLAGLNLPIDVLHRIYHANAEALGY